MLTSESHTWLSKRNIGLLFILLSSMFMLAFDFFHDLKCITPFYDDTTSYFYAAESIVHGKLDSFRTPVYPLLCHASLLLFGKQALNALAVLNAIAFLASIVIFFTTAKMLTRRTWIILLTTLMYAWFPGCYQFVFAPMTESLTMSATVVLLYSSLCIIKGHKTTFHCIFLPLFLALMVFTRPFCICFSPIVVILLCYAALHRMPRKQLRLFFASSLTAAAMLLAYCAAIYQQYHIFSFSTVSILNKYVQLYLYGMDEGIPSRRLAPTYTTVPGKNNERIEFVEYLFWNASPSNVEKVNEAYSKNRQRYIKNKILGFHSTFYLHLPVKWTIHTYLQSAFSIDLSSIYLFTCIFAVLQIFLFFARRKNILFALIMIEIVTATIFTTTWGAYGDIARLYMPLFPALFMMVACFLNSFSYSIKETR